MTEELIDISLGIDRPQVAVEKDGISEKNKGGRPKGKPKYGNFKLNIYLSEEEFRLFKDFIAEAWHDKNSSGAGRFLLMKMLHEWVRKGRRKNLNIDLLIEIFANKLLNVTYIFFSGFYKSFYLCLIINHKIIIIFIHSFLHKFTVECCMGFIK